MMPDFLDNINKHLRYSSYSTLVEDLYIKALIDSFERLSVIPGIANKTENQIRNHLAFDLENNNQLLALLFQTKLLKLTKENTLLITPIDTKRTDIEFYISGSGDFIVECKNLKSADQRYISEGIDRFVNKVYGAADAEAALIGFVVGGKVNSILSRMEVRIQNEASCVKNYTHATKKCNGYEFSFHSSHIRSNISTIILHHLFVNLT